MTVMSTVHNIKKQFLENVISTVTNIFFNNQRKRKTETVVKDRVAAFKKYKRDK